MAFGQVEIGMDDRTYDLLMDLVREIGYIGSQLREIVEKLEQMNG